jgi:2-polyprenyl-3-methyl-5-hydroxy-6-metoxy-1,4-benzoquinol methylase
VKGKAKWHYLEWDASKVARFYDFAANWAAWQQDYFSRQVGKGIVKFLRYVAPLQGRILDYGCGPGYLVEHLLEAGIRCEGVDVSPDSVKFINEKFANHPLWNGAKLSTDEGLPLPSDSFDLIVCVEVIEHVVPAIVSRLLGDFRRILKPETGRLLITTPNSEDLSRNQVYCPECGSVFHRVQHVQSFTEASLNKLLSQYGFTTVFSGAMNFALLQQPLLPSFWDWSPRVFVRAFKWLLAEVLDLTSMRTTTSSGHRLKQLLGDGPNLVWVGRKV